MSVITCAFHGEGLTAIAVARCPTPTENTTMNLTIVGVSTTTGIIYAARLAAADITAQCPMLAGAPELLCEFLEMGYGKKHSIDLKEGTLFATFTMKIGKQNYTISTQMVNLRQQAKNVDAKLARTEALLVASNTRNALAESKITILTQQLEEAKRSADEQSALHRSDADAHLLARPATEARPAEARPRKTRRTIVPTFIAPDLIAEASAAVESAATTE